MFRFLMIALLGLSLSACATVTRGSNDDWIATSEPSGARVETTNGHMCSQTPCTIKMPRRSEFVATFSRDGYQTVTVHVDNRIAGSGAVGLAGNVLIGGIIGVGVDAVSGAALDLYPNPAHVILTPLADGEESGPAQMYLNPADGTNPYPEAEEEVEEEAGETYDPMS